MVGVPSLRVGLLAAAILSSTTCYSSTIENDAKLENIASSKATTSRILSKQALIAYGRPPNTGGYNGDDSEEENAGNGGDSVVGDDTSQQGFAVEFDRPSNTGASTDFDEDFENDPKGSTADMMLVLEPECRVDVR